MWRNRNRNLKKRKTQRVREEIRKINQKIKVKFVANNYKLLYSPKSFKISKI